MHKEQLIIESYLSGNTLSEVAKQFGYRSYDPIKLILRKNNVKLRTNSEAQRNRKIHNPGRHRGASGSRNRKWSGGKKMTKDGYIYIYSPDHLNKTCNYVLEHRLVIEKSIGRLLTKDEVVHHKDGNKKNNSLENLQLMSKAEHISLHARERAENKRKNSMATTTSDSSLKSGNIGERPEMENTEERSLSNKTDFSVTTKCPDSLVDEDIV